MVTHIIRHPVYLQAAKLIHQMTRFMPKKIFQRLADQSAVGLFSVQKLPGNVFDEFVMNMPIECAGKNSRFTFEGQLCTFA